MENKTIIDVAAAGTGIGTWFSFLPDVAALFTIVWLAIRLWETDTVRNWTGRA